MDYLVSNSNKYELESFKSVDSLKEVTEVDANSIILLHSFQEDSYQASLLLSDIYRTKGANKFIYINENPLEGVKVLVDSLRGVVEEDESLLEDKDEIEGLVELVKEDSLSVALGEQENEHSSFKVLTEFLTKFAEGDESLNDDLYLAVVNRAVSNISKDMKLRDEKIDLMGKGVIATYNNTTKVINSLQAESEKMKNTLLEIEQDREYAKASRNRLGSLTYYPSITYTGNTPLVVFKEISACRYLTSMVLAYMNHLKTVKNKRVRLIVVTGKQELLRKRYEGFYELTPQSIRRSDAITRDIAFTSTPLRDMMLHMTKQSDEVILVLDRTYEKDPIFTGKSKVIYGVTSLREVHAHNLKQEDCIMSLRGTKRMLMRLTHIGEYPTDKESRLDRYEKSFYKDFNAIDDYLGIRK
ncbi:hypothetical protein P9X10_00430 [Bacillus cereus]|nr:hypothetical protein [Bacillus cereus]